MKKFSGPEDASEITVPYAGSSLVYFYTHIYNRSGKECTLICLGMFKCKLDYHADLLDYESMFFNNNLSVTNNIY